MNNPAAMVVSLGRIRVGWTSGIFVLTVFTGALLLFLLEPMFVKMALPRLGGSSEVWTASVLFYQTMLLAGYAYAHVLLRVRRVQTQVLIHALLCAFTVSVLPVAIAPGSQPQSAALAIPWLLRTLVVTVGLPFFVLSATSPLLQAWFARARPAQNAYGLYAASNVGSFVAMGLYPFVIEPTWGLHVQTTAWAWGYAGFVACLAGCALGLRGTVAVVVNSGAAEPIAWTRKLRWIGWAFVPSSLMLSVTTYLSERVAPIPLLWTLPLGIYLLTFAVVFGTRARPIIAAANRFAPLALMPLVFMLTVHGALAANFEIPFHLVAFAALALVCHGALANDRPPAAKLTEFYLFIALGGVLGGAFNSVIAPLIFPDVFEYPIVIAIACFTLAPRSPDARPGDGRRDFLWPAIFAVALCLLLVVTAHAGSLTRPLTIVTIGAAAIACFSFGDRPRRFGLGITALLAIGAARGLFSGDLATERNFYGVKHVTRVGVFHTLVHGHTVHGAQDMTAAHQRDPQTYYTREGPLGDIFRAAAKRVPAVAVVGLGAGTTACYRKPGAAWTFYEIDPGVVAIARDPRLFRYLADCARDSPIVIGDARLSLVRERPAAFDLIILDAYASDAIPTHLLTREAMALYRSRLSAHGAIAFHISNSYFDFAPLVAALANDAGMLSRLRIDPPRPITATAYFAGSTWVLVARRTGDLGAIGHDPRWVHIQPGPRVWTDDYSSIVTLLRGRS